MQIIVQIKINNVKTHLKWHCHYNPCPGYSGMPQYNGTHSLTRLVLHAILSESGPIRACHYTRDNPLVTYSGTLETPLPMRPAVLIDLGMPI